jgi:hypothetical protein
MSRRLLAALALLCLATIVVRCPASWAFAFAPSGLRCAAAFGSIWHGACRGLRSGALRLETVDWQLHPLALLRARLGLAVHVADPRLRMQGEFELGFGGRVACRDLIASLPIDSAPLPLFPRGWAGELQLALTAAQFLHGRPSALLGTISVQQLQQLAPPLAFGSYSVRFTYPPDGNGMQHGQLADAGGPLALSGDLQLGSRGQYELNGTVAAREGSPPELARSLELLGPAEASGRRPFSIAGTL